MNSHVGGKPHALDDGAGNQGSGDDGKGALKGHEQDVRDGSLRFNRHSAQKQAREITDDRVAGRERERVTGDGPQDADESERNHAHHHRVQGVFRPHQPAIEKCQRGSHQEHQRRCDQHPRRVRLIDRGRRSLGARDGRHHQQHQRSKNHPASGIHVHELLICVRTISTGGLRPAGPPSPTNG